MAYTTHINADDVIWMNSYSGVFCNIYQHVMNIYDVSVGIQVYFDGIWLYILIYVRTLLCFTIT